MEIVRALEPLHAGLRPRQTGAKNRLQSMIRKGEARFCEKFMLKQNTGAG
jgi:hypothetical protein